MRLPREMPERRKVMRKCVFGSPKVVDGEEGEDEVSGGAGGETEVSWRAATVREAAVPLWAEHRCAVKRELRKLLAVRPVRAGRATLSIGMGRRG